MKKNRRFIAGAMCPRCAKLDRIFVYSDAGVNVKECFDCGYREKMVENNTINEVQTRVNKNADGVLVSEFKTKAALMDDQIKTEHLKENAKVDAVKIIAPNDGKIH